MARPGHDDDNNRPQAHEQHQQAHDQGRAERSGGDNGQRQHFEQRQQVQSDAARGGGFDRSRFERVERSPQQAQVQQQQQQQQQRAFERRGGNYDGYRRERSGFTGVQAQQVQQSGSWARDRGSWSHDRDGDYRQREAQQTQVRDRSRWSGSWNRDWRNDRRYDWHSYRDRHRSIFHLGIYYDPFGYGYRSFDIGYQLMPAYFGQQYWIDPAMYGLPFAPPGTEWIRYWNDAVLVDMYSGQVIDVIRNFFW